MCPNCVKFLHYTWLHKTVHNVCRPSLHSDASCTRLLCGYWVAGMVANCTVKNKMGVLWWVFYPLHFWCPSQIPIFSNFNFLEVRATIIGSVYQTSCLLGSVYEFLLGDFFFFLCAYPRYLQCSHLTHPKCVETYPFPNWKFCCKKCAHQRILPLKHHEV